MSKITHQIVKRGGGWAYGVDGDFSEPYSMQKKTRRGVERAAHEQVLPGPSTGMSSEGQDARWHGELTAGGTRPEAEIRG